MEDNIGKLHRTDYYDQFEETDSIEEVEFDSDCEWDGNGDTETFDVSIDIVGDSLSPTNPNDEYLISLFLNELRQDLSIERLNECVSGSSGRGEGSESGGEKGDVGRAVRNSRLKVYIDTLYKTSILNSFVVDSDSPSTVELI